MGGELRAADAQELSSWLEQADLEAEADYATWDVQREHYIDATVEPAGSRAEDASRRSPAPVPVAAYVYRS